MLAHGAPRLRTCLLWASVTLAAATPLRAQSDAVGDLRDELARIREATNLQLGGHLAGAERVLRDVIAHNPTSLTGMLLLEQLLTQQNRLAEILPLVDELIRRDPTSAIGHQLRARTYLKLGRTDDLERAGEAWMAAAPRLETPYREIGLLWLERREYQRALRVLERGRDRIAAPGALALELGDVQLAAGNLEQAVREWDRAVGTAGQGFMGVQRRLRALPDGGSAASPLLVHSLVRDPSTVGRRRAALQLALDAGLGAEAEKTAPQVLAALTPAEREPFLADVARRADAAGLARVGYWAYGQLIATTERGPERLLALRTRQAQLALLAGDTAGAATAYQQLELATAPGSPQRREAVAVRIQLAAREGEVARAASELQAFRTEYPEAAELDETAAAVAESLLTAGRVEGAEQAVAGVRGPRSAIVRGQSLLRRGDVANAAAEFMAAAPALRGREATRVIALAAVLTRLSSSAGELLGSAVAAMGEDAPGALRDLVDRSAGLPQAERAAVLDFAAARADEAGLAEVSEQARRALLEVAPRSPFAPAALFWLGHHASTQPEQQDQATVLLERLIIDYPRSALVPQARRELDRISGRSPASASSKAGVS